MEAFCRYIDTLNDWAGKVASLLFIPLIFIVTIEVVARYFFNSPTRWAWPVNIQLGAVLIIIGGGHTLLHGGHVAVDVVVLRLSPRARTIIDLVTSVLVFFSVGALLWLAIGEAGWSVALRERLQMSIWEPPLYPLKIVVAIGVFLLLIQAIAKFIRDLTIVTRSGRGNRS